MPNIPVTGMGMGMGVLCGRRWLWYAFVYCHHHHMTMILLINASPCSPPKILHTHTRILLLSQGPAAECHGMVLL